MLFWNVADVIRLVAPIWRNARLGPYAGATIQTLGDSEDTVVVSRCANLQEKQVMKLNVAQVERALGQIDARALPDNHPVVPQLNTLFGEHTFFLDGNGLNVLEPAEIPEAETKTAQVVNLACWGDADLTRLGPHEPEPTGAIVVLDLIH